MASQAEWESALAGYRKAIERLEHKLIRTGSLALVEAPSGAGRRLRECGDLEDELASARDEIGALSTHNRILQHGLDAGLRRQGDLERMLTAAIVLLDKALGRPVTRDELRRADAAEARECDERIGRAIIGFNPSGADVMLGRRGPC